MCRGVRRQIGRHFNKKLFNCKMFNNFVITNIGLDPNPDSAKYLDPDPGSAKYSNPDSAKYLDLVRKISGSGSGSGFSKIPGSGSGFSKISGSGSGLKKIYGSGFSKIYGAGFSESGSKTLPQILLKNWRITKGVHGTRYLWDELVLICL